MKYCDLHCHSDYSDGTCTPGELIEIALSSGLSALALTDHNTLEGLRDFMEAGQGKLEICCGCEFTTEDQGQELHLLGLFLESAHCELLQDALKQQLQGKIESNRLTIENLQKAGYDVSYEEFVSVLGPGYKNRVHIARYLIDKGIICSVDEAFQGLLASGGPYYAESAKLDFYEMISLIHEAGGVSVWAHPLFHVNKEECRRIARKARDYGLDGMEVSYCTYSREDSDFMMKLSEELGLLKSGGSDFHGDNKPGLKMGSGYGEMLVPMEWYERLRERSQEKGKK